MTKVKDDERILKAAGEKQRGTLQGRLHKAISLFFCRTWQALYIQTAERKKTCKQEYYTLHLLKVLFRIEGERVSQAEAKGVYHH